MAPSNYRIRNAHAPHQLEDALGRFDPLLDAFDGFVTQQAAYVRI